MAQTPIHETLPKGIHMLTICVIPFLPIVRIPIDLAVLGGMKI